MIWHREPGPAPAVLPARTGAPRDVLQGPERGRGRRLGHAGQGRQLRAGQPAQLRLRRQGLPGQPRPRRDHGAKCYPTLAAIPDPVELVVVTVDLAACAGADRRMRRAGHSQHGDRLRRRQGAGRRQGSRWKPRSGGRRASTTCASSAPTASASSTGTRAWTPSSRCRSACCAPTGRAGHDHPVGHGGRRLPGARRRLGVSKFVSYGNRADVDEADLLAYLADDPETDMIAMYVEGLEDGRKFLERAPAVTRKKPVVVFKVGQHRAAARALRCRTPASSAAPTGWSLGAFKQAGLIAGGQHRGAAGGEQGAGDAAEPARGNRVAMISNGAGTMVQGIDLLKAERAGDARAEPTTICRACARSIRPSTWCRTRWT